MSKKAKHYFNDTFQTNYYFFIGWQPQEFESYLKRNYKIEVYCERANGKTIQFDHKGNIVTAIWVIDKNRNDILVHECVHACNMTLFGVGVQANWDNDEVQAYLTQRLFTEAIK